VDDATLFERQLQTLRALYRTIAASSPGSRLLERDGVTAAIVPATPDRSVCNGVVYDHGRSLAGALDELARAYEEAGVRAWTVWVPGRDRDTAAILERAGHLLDATPAAMAMDLERFDAPEPAGVEIDDAPLASEVARLNDAAYGYDGDFERALERFPGSVRCYVAREDGTAVACAVAELHEGDCGIGWVATVPEARGRGLASALMTRALLDARQAGCTTTSLQATRAGEPVYLRLGYRDLGRLQMWERRRERPPEL
jgi:GNAT superfamily N-acetyltransferase